jgi:uncharacterized membrane protein YgcG
VAAGDAFSARQRDEIERAIDIARRETGLEFAVYVGAANADPRAFARRLLAELPDPGRSVLVVVDPASRRLEIISGVVAGRVVDSRACSLAAATMTSAFAAGDLVGGIANGVILLGEQARRPPSLHHEVH